MARHVAPAVRSMTRLSGALAVGLLLVLLQASACTRVQSEPPRAGTAPPHEEQQAPSASPQVEQPRSKPAEPPMTTQPKPAEPPASKPAEQPQPRPPVPPPPKPATPPPPRPVTPPAPKPAAPPPPAAGGGRDRRLDRSREATARYQRDRVVHQAGAQERSRRPAGASPHVP